MKSFSSSSRQVLLVWLVAALAIWGHNLLRIAGAVQPAEPPLASHQPVFPQPLWQPTPTPIPFTGAFPDPFHPPASDAEPAIPPVLDETLEFRLLGVVGQRALLHRGDGPIQILAVGDSLGPARVREVELGQVLLTIGDRLITLSLADTPAASLESP